MLTGTVNLHNLPNSDKISHSEGVRLHTHQQGVINTLKDKQDNRQFKHPVTFVLVVKKKKSIYIVGQKSI